MPVLASLGSRVGGIAAAMTRIGRRAPWWLGVFLLALGVRLGFILLVDPPVNYSTAAGYLSWALDLAAQKDLLDFILNSDQWRDWNGVCTLAPLYQLFLMGIIKLFGAHLLPIRVIQSILGALAAVSAGVIGRAVGGARGTWAGVAMALYWPLVEMPADTLTENLHTPLFVAALAALVLAIPREHSRSRTVLAATSGVLLGLAALTRAVSFAFIPLAGVWALIEARRRRGLLLACVIVAAGMTTIAPWTLRNLRFYGELVPIETAGTYGVWSDNAFVSRGEYQRQLLSTLAHAREGDRARRFLVLARRNVAQAPRAFAGKVQGNLQHILRPDALRSWLVNDDPAPGWRVCADLLFQDAVFLAAQGLFVVFLVAGPGSPGRRLLVLWIAFYLAMLTVVFHTEIRYRSALVPFLLVGAAGCWTASLDAHRKGAWRRWAGLALGAMLILADLIPYAGPASDALASLAPLWRARRAVAQGRFDDAQREAQEAAARDPRSPRPWRLHGKWLAEADQPLRAAEAYARAARYFRNGWLAAFVPPLLRDAGRTESASTRPVVRPKVPVNGSEWDVLEAAWRELLAPRTDCVWLGQDDTGAVRDFFSPVKGGRWTRHEARVRLRPARLTGSDPLVIVMGAPPPVPFDAPVVTVHVSGGETARFALGRRAGVFHMTAATTPGTPVEIEIEAPTWTRPGRPAEQGVLVARVCVGAEAARAVDVALR